MKTPLLSVLCASFLSVTAWPQNSENLLARYAFDQAPQQDRSQAEDRDKPLRSAIAKDLSEPLANGTRWLSEPVPALQFGAVDYVALPKTLRGHGVFSVSIWFLPDAENTPMTLLGAGGGYNLSIQYKGGAGGVLRWAQFTEGWQPAVQSDAPIGAKKWHHAVVTCDGAQTRLYLDGALQKQVSPSKGAIPETGEPEYLGAISARPAEMWIGCLRDVRYYGEALDANKVQALYAADKERMATAIAPSEKNKVAWRTPNSVDYLALVKGYADVMIDKGRDTYGTKPSPLFAAGLNRYTFQIGYFPGISGIRGSDRVTTGANPMTDENLYQVLYALTAITKEPRYAAEADKALKFFFENAQSPATGLMAWGEHTGWSFETESPVSSAHFIHEFARPWVLWDRCYVLAHDPCVKFARGLWDHQIGDQKTGNFSRHAQWDRHAPGTNCDFPRHAGFYIATWSRAYADTKDPVFLKAIETLTDRYIGKKSPQSGAIRSMELKPAHYPCVEVWPQSSLSLAIDLSTGARAIEETAKPLAEKMRGLAADIDHAFFAMKHSQGAADEFFVTTANVDTLEPVSEKEHDAYAKLWAASYGRFSSCQVANLCLARYNQLPEGETKAGYKKLVLDCASRYLQSEPVKCGYPGTMGEAIELLTDAYVLTKDKAYLQRAEQFAQAATERFFPNDVPLPVASASNVHYETVTSGDTLMLALLHFWNAKQDKPAEIQITYCDR